MWVSKVKMDIVCLRTTYIFCTMVRMCDTVFLIGTAAEMRQFFLCKE